MLDKINLFLIIIATAVILVILYDLYTDFNEFKKEYEEDQEEKDTKLKGLFKNVDNNDKKIMKKSTDNRDLIGSLVDALDRSGSEEFKQKFIEHYDELTKKELKEQIQKIQQIQKKEQLQKKEQIQQIQQIQQILNNNATAGNSTTGNATAGNAATGNATTGNAATGNTATDNTATDNATTGNSTTGNATTGNATTGNSTTGNATTGNATTGNATTDNDDYEYTTGTNCNDNKITNFNTCKELASQYKKKTNLKINTEDLKQDGVCAMKMERTINDIIIKFNMNSDGTLICKKTKEILLQELKEEDRILSDKFLKHNEIGEEIKKNVRESNPTEQEALKKYNAWRKIKVKLEEESFKIQQKKNKLKKLDKFNPNVSVFTEASFRV